MASRASGGHGTIPAWCFQAGTDPGLWHCARGPGQRAGPFAKIKPAETWLNFCMINMAYSEEETYGIAPV